MLVSSCITLITAISASETQYARDFQSALIITGSEAYAHAQE